VLSIKTLSPDNVGDLEAQVAYLFEGQESDYWARSATHTEYWGALSKRWGRWGGRVDRADFELLMSGVHPGWGLQVRTGPKGKHRAGLDLTFSAPKSVSVLVALGREELRHAHRQAVRDALDYIERHYVRYRLVRNGRVTYHKAHEVLYAVFEHEVSRAKQPQLHSHCVLFNFTLCPDGRFRAISDEEIYRAVLSAGAVYRASLARYIQECGYGIRLTDPDKFLFEIAGVPDGVLEALSKRRRQIEALVARWRREGRYPDADERKLYELACLKSRPAKDENIRLRDLPIQAEVDLALEMAGLSRGELLARADALADVLPAGESDPHAAVRRAVRILGEHSTFFPLHAVIRQALALGAGRLDVYKVEKALGDLIVSGEVRAWPVEGYATVLITTSELIEAEKEFLRRIEAGKNSVRPLVEGAVTVPEGLGPDQAEAYKYVLGAPHRIVGIVGVAGAGKSRLIETLVRTLEGEGYRVAVVAPTGKAADELVKLGLRACTVDSYLTELSRRAGSDSTPGGQGTPPPVAHHDVLIVDEASMLGSLKARALLDALPAGRLILVGDPRQLRPVPAGAPFENAVVFGFLPHAALTRIVRQEPAEYRRVVYEAARDPVRAVHVLERLGRLHRCEMLAEVADAIWRMGGPDRAVVVTPLRESASILNELIRSEARRQGLLVGGDHRFIVLTPLDSVLEVRPGDRIGPGAWRIPPIAVEDRDEGFVVTTDRGVTYNLQELADQGWRAWRPREIALAVGDRVVFTRNSKEYSVRNGQVGTVREVSGSVILVDLGGGRSVQVDLHKYPFVDYAYAITTHKAQGLTVDSVVCHLPADYADARQFYVQVSRGRRSVVVFTDRPIDLVKRLGDRGAEMAARRALREGAALPVRLEALLSQGLVRSDDDLPALLREARARTVWTPSPEAARAVRERLRAAGVKGVRVKTGPPSRRFVAYLPDPVRDLEAPTVVALLDRASGIASPHPEAVPEAVRRLARRRALPPPDLNLWGLEFTLRHDYEYAYLRREADLRERESIAFVGGLLRGEGGPGEGPAAGRIPVDFTAERIHVQFEVSDDVLERRRIENANRMLINAVWKGDADRVREALRLGADPDHGNALIIAVRNGHREVVDVLVRAGATLDARDDRGATALHWASAKGDVELVRRLVEAGADVNAKDSMGYTPAQVAAAMGHNLYEALQARPALPPPAREGEGWKVIYDDGSTVIMEGPPEGEVRFGPPPPVDVSPARRTGWDYDTVNKTQIANCLRAIGAERYEVVAIEMLPDGTKGRRLVRLEGTVEDIVGQVGILRKLNARGAAVYFRPLAPTDSVMIDFDGPVRREDLFRVGLDPVALVETRPGRLQAWVRVSERMLGVEESKVVAKTLVERLRAMGLPADPAATAGTEQYARMPGFARHDVEGRPFSRLVHYSIKDRPVSEFANKVYKEIRELQERREASGAEVNIEPPRPIEFIRKRLAGVDVFDAYRRIWEALRDRHAARFGQVDPSSVDYNTCLVLLAAGYGPGAVRRALLEISPRTGRKHDWEDYSLRTVRKAAEALATDRGRMQAKLNAANIPSLGPEGPERGPIRDRGPEMGI